jgi:hypothetical protein
VNADFRNFNELKDVYGNASLVADLAKLFHRELGIPAEVLLSRPTHLPSLPYPSIPSGLDITHCTSSSGDVQITDFPHRRSTLNRDGKDEQLLPFMAKSQACPVLVGDA